MKNKVILISVDGMRPDGFLACGNPFIHDMMRRSYRTHGTDLPEDTTIPMFYFGRNFEPGKRFEGGSILDIAPTIAALMGADASPEWEGSPVIDGCIPR